MESPDYEILIPSHPKDHSKLPYVIERALKYTDAQHIHLVVPDPDTVKHISCPQVTIHADDDVLPFDASRFQWRSNWVYQQFIKLFQQVTSTDWYLCFCSDLVLNKPYPVFHGGMPVMVLGRNPDDRMEQYDIFNKLTVGMSRKSPFNFISDGPLYKRSLIEEMLSENRYTRESFMERAVAIVEPGCAPGDAEVYTNWVYHKRPGLYRAARLHNELNGKYESGEYTPEEIEEVIEKWKDDDTVDTISFHSWGP